MIRLFIEILEAAARGANIAADARRLMKRVPVVWKDGGWWATINGTEVPVTLWDATTTTEIKGLEARLPFGSEAVSHSGLSPEDRVRHAVRIRRLLREPWFRKGYEDRGGRK